MQRSLSSRPRGTRVGRVAILPGDLLAYGLISVLSFAFVGVLIFGLLGGRSAVVVAPGTLSPAVRLDGAYGVEQNVAGSFQWTRPEATLLADLPIAGSYVVTLTVQDSPQNAAPRTLTVLLDGTSAGTVTLGGEFKTFTFRREGLRGAWDATLPPLRIELRTTPYRAASDPRDLGVIFRGATIQAITPTPAEWLWRTLPVVLILGGSYGLLRACRVRPLAAGVGLGLGGAALVALIALQQPLLLVRLVYALSEHPSVVGAVLAALIILVGVAVIRPTATARGLTVALLALPLVSQLGALIWMVWIAPVQVPWYDDLFDSRMIWDARYGKLTWADFWQLYAAHRIVTLRLVNLLAITLTDWDRRVILTLQIAATAMTLLLLAAVLWRTVSSTRLRVVLLAICGALLFALSQYGQWLLGYGLQFHLAILGLSVGLWALTARPCRWGHLLLAAVSVWLASWSGLHGLVAWGVLLPLVWLTGWRKMIVWVLCAVPVVGTYVVGFPRDSVQQLQAGEVIRFALANLGAPLGALQPLIARTQFWHHDHVTLDYRWSVWIGLAGVCLFALNLATLLAQRQRSLIERALPWCCLALFAASCAVMTALGRGSRTDIALTSRYQNFTVLWWCALAVIGGLTVATLWAARAGRRPMWQTWRGLVVAVNLIALVLGSGAFSEVNATSALVARDWHGTLRQTESCVRDITTAPDACMEILHPLAPAARLRLAQLAQHRLALYRSGPVPSSAPTAPGDPGSAPDLTQLRPLGFSALYRIDGLPGPLDQIDGLAPPLRLPAGTPLVFTGWAIDVTAVPLSPAGGVFLTLDDQAPRWVPLDRERPEIAQRFDPAYLRGGFQATWSAEGLAPGRHTLRVTVVTANRRAFFPPSLPVSFTVE